MSASLTSVSDAPASGSSDPPKVADVADAASPFEAAVRWMKRIGIEASGRRNVRSVTSSEPSSLVMLSS